MLIYIFRFPIFYLIKLVRIYQSQIVIQLDI